jgi:hypothetical protein
MIPDVNILPTCLDENASREVHSNPCGSFLNALPGRYSVAAARGGFWPIRVSDIQLDSRQEWRFDLTLDIAAVAAVVEMRALSAQVNTGNATLISAWARAT